MADAHRDPRVNARAPAGDLAAGRRALAGQGWTVQEAIIALLRRATDDPSGVAAFLEVYRPAPKRRGRPPRTRG